MEFPAFHRRVYGATREVCARYDLWLAGGYAIRAHELVERESQDLDFATVHSTPLPAIAEDVTTALAAAGFDTTLMEVMFRSARILATEPRTGESCEVDLLKEALQHPAAMLRVGPVVHLDDAIGMKTRALADRGYPRDLIDVAAAANLYGIRDMEGLARRQSEEFSVQGLAARLEACELMPDRAFEAYGLDAEAIAAVRRFAFDWLEDIKAAAGRGRRHRPRSAPRLTPGRRHGQA